MTNNPENMPENIYAWPNDSDTLCGQWNHYPVEKTSYTRTDIHKTLAEENKRLREALSDLTNACGVLGVVGDVITNARKTLNQTKGLKDER